MIRWLNPFPGPLVIELRFASEPEVGDGNSPEVRSYRHNRRVLHSPKEDVPGRRSGGSGVGWAPAPELAPDEAILLSYSILDI